ncbi:MAG TPA: DUF4350 domain-containing protein [Allosphingosinicella sp.]|jgi:hypothetical protein
MTASATGETFDVKVVIGLIGAGVIAFAAFLLLAAYADDFRSGLDGRPHPLSLSATGFKGLTQLLEATGARPRLIRSGDGLDTEDLVVAALDETLAEGALAALTDRRESQATLLILPKWSTAPDELHPGWVRRIGPHSPGDVAELLEGVADVTVSHDEVPAGGAAVGGNYLEGVRVPAPALSQTIAGEDLTPLLTHAGGGILLARLGEGPLYILADPDLMSNHGLRDARTARAALDILALLNSTGAEGIAFDLTLNGFGRKPSLLKLLLEPPFLVLTLALAAAALLAGLHGAFRFGPERREERVIALGKGALVENSAGLIRSARREHRAGGAYAELVRETAAREAGAAGLTGAELDAYLDRLSRAGGPRFSALAARIAAARDRDELVSAARALFQWKKDISS